ncbi:MAG: hypothetical protein E6K77_04750 [Candidatus Eisenbacteria bacterium]|uniref:YdbS-like PH domain-containing protein n=1 Tax=Eiseniibacteriota bacterium TaxID=2212470 RepID=A0A538SQX8_UNCEI|nr:MAG: hypothetical protein E6K74_08380 [Candidatus Eisenbacteria bacterium]TMQ63644.1 MAG: hypothetical protein E6K77_04750 [Candidatus Eisenbacteria bacterium]
MSYVENNLIPGETILYRTKLHWIVLFWPVLVGSLLGLISVLLFFSAVASRSGSSQSHSVAAGTGAFFLVVGAAIIGFGILRRNATEIAVTNKRVLIKTGLLSRRTIELLLSKIESIGVDESPSGRIFGFGTVIVRGTGGTPESFDQIAHPLEFRRQVHAHVEDGPTKGR